MSQFMPKNHASQRAVSCLAHPLSLAAFGLLLLNDYLLVFLGGGLLFFLPFILWTFNILPHYRLAQFLGITLGCG